jgi:[acyl-carrier-protein] S-malonyltransferase
MFPGQGSQHVGMGAELVKWSKEAARVYEQADAVLGEKLSHLMLGYDKQGQTAASAAGTGAGGGGVGQAKLNLTANAQPAILTHSVAILETLKVSLRATTFSLHSIVFILPSIRLNLESTVWKPWERV